MSQDLDREKFAFTLVNRFSPLLEKLGNGVV